MVEQEENIFEDINMEDVPITIDYIMKTHSRLVGRILTQLEAMLPPGQQLTRGKKIMREDLYEFRKKLIPVLLYGEVPDKF